MNFGWIGAVTDDGITAAVEVTGPVDIRLAVSTSSSMTSPIFSSTITDADGWNKLTITGLTANTEYFWALEEDSVVGSSEGSFFTLPTEGQAANFTVALASCATSASTANTFTRIETRKPKFFMHMGDFHYEDILTNNEQLFIDAYEANLASSTQGPMYKNVPIAYIFDDHDFGGGNDTDGDVVSRPASLAAYHKVVPHYPLALTGPEADTAIGQTWVCGRVRFVMLDVRTESDHSGTPTTNTFLGADQLAWFLNLIETFTEHMMVVSVSVPWIYNSPASEDKWNNASAERETISNAIQAHARGRVLIVHGDSHMLAMDDGTNSTYATNQFGNGPRVFCAAPLDRSNSVKGGPYSEGTHTDSTTQYGVLDFTDDGTDITVTATGYDAVGDTSVVSMTWTVAPYNALSSQIVYWAEDVTEADTFAAGSVVHVRDEGTIPTRFRKDGGWVYLSKVMSAQGAEAEWIDTILTVSGGVVVGLATESVTAPALAVARTLEVGSASEELLVHAVTVSRTYVVGAASEASAAAAVGRARVIDVGRGLESSSATATTHSRTELALQAAEEDIARSVTAARAVTLGQAAEANAATSIVASGALSVGLAAETAIAAVVGRLRTAGVGLATSAESASVMVPLRALSTAIASETSTALAMQSSRTVVVAGATEVDTAGAGGVGIVGGEEPEPGDGSFCIIIRRRRKV